MLKQFITVLFQNSAVRVLKNLLVWMLALVSLEMPQLISKTVISGVGFYGSDEEIYYFGDDGQELPEQKIKNRELRTKTGKCYKHFS